MVRKKADNNGNGKVQEPVTSTENLVKLTEETLGVNLSKTDPINISSVLDADPNQNDEDFEFDVSVLEDQPNGGFSHEELKYCSQATGMEPGKLVQMIVNDTLTGDGQRANLIKQLGIEEKEREKQEKLKAIAKQKLTKELEIQRLEVEAKAIFNGLV